MAGAATSGNSNKKTRGEEGYDAEVMAVRNAWQLGSLGVSAQAASFALTSGPSAGRPASAASGGVVVYPGTTPVADGWFTMPRKSTSE